MLLRVLLSTAIKSYGTLFSAIYTKAPIRCSKGFVRKNVMLVRSMGVLKSLLYINDSLLFII